MHSTYYNIIKFVLKIVFVCVYIHVCVMGVVAAVNLNFLSEDHSKTYKREILCACFLGSSLTFSLYFNLQRKGDSSPTHKFKNSLV